MHTYTVEQLHAMPTIRSGPVNDDLKVDTGKARVWVRRGAGSPAIIVMIRDYGLWERVGAFNDRLSVPCQRLVER